MWPQSAEPAFQSTSWLDFYNSWICMKRTLAEKLEQGDLNIISAVSTVQAIWCGSILSIAWDGTSKTVYHGKRQRTIAEKQVTTDTWEILLKRENIVGLPADQQTLWQIEYNGILTTRTIGASQSVLIPSEVQEKVLTVTYVLVGDNFSLFLELPRPQLE